MTTAKGIKILETKQHNSDIIEPTFSCHTVAGCLVHFFIHVSRLLKQSRLRNSLRNLNMLCGLYHPINIHILYRLIPLSLSQIHYLRLPGIELSNSDLSNNNNKILFPSNHSKFQIKPPIINDKSPHQHRIPIPIDLIQK